eukprot:TRINITY_DN427_c0_g1_i2.p1 TRINITY_DN427_c0_g1~~TRINITY_DN427_c0_g1_i2.p1  ORF type:complete len:570 (-),score=79.07 TRINITY_DN427_c0_g1_i2:31-1740(-)
MKTQVCCFFIMDVFYPCFAFEIQENMSFDHALQCRAQPANDLAQKLSISSLAICHKLRITSTTELLDLLAGGSEAATATSLPVPSISVATPWNINIDYATSPFVYPVNKHELRIRSAPLANVREIVHLGVGGFGCVWNAAWITRGLSDHGLDVTGQPPTCSVDVPENFQYGLTDVMFAETTSGKYIPRALLIDTDGEDLMEFRLQAIRRIWERSQFIDGRESCGSVFSRGHTDISCLLERALDSVRRQAEACCSLQGFQMTHFLAGGCGTGFGSRLLEELSDHYPGKVKFSHCMLPPRGRTSSFPVTADYNALLSIPALSQHCDIIVTHEWERTERYMWNVCDSGSLDDKMGYLAMVSAASTDPCRFVNATTHDTWSMAQLAGSLVSRDPFRFVAAQFAPFETGRRCYAPISYNDISLGQALDRRMLLGYIGSWHKVDPLASALIVRGTISLADYQQFAAKRWAGSNKVPAQCVITEERARDSVLLCNQFPFSGCYIESSSGLGEELERLLARASGMRKRRAFYHWYDCDASRPVDELFAETSECVHRIVDEYHSLYPQDDDDAGFVEY